MAMHLFYNNYIDDQLVTGNDLKEMTLGELKVNGFCCWVGCRRFGSPYMHMMKECKEWSSAWNGAIP